MKRSYSFPYNGLLITIDPETNSDGTTTGDYGYFVDIESSIKRIDEDYGYTTSEAAEEAAKKSVDDYLAFIHPDSDPSNDGADDVVKMMMKVEADKTDKRKK